MSATTTKKVEIQPPEAPIPETFRAAADELRAIQQRIALEASPKDGETPDIGIIKPFLERFKKLEAFCLREIEATRALTEEASV